MNIAIVGDGIAARALLYEYSKFKDSENLNFTQFSAEDFAPACSYKSTAMVSLNGIKKGISPLGDLIIDSYKLFEDNIVNSFNGIEASVQYFIGDADKLKLRFDETYSFQDVFDNKHYGIKEACYLINPKILMNDLKKSYSNLNVTYVNRFITKVSDLDSFDKVIIASGGFNYLLFKDSFKSKKIFESSKLVPGHFLETSCDLGTKSFVFTVYGENLLYRSSDNKLLIGGTTQNESANPVLTKDIGSLLKLYQHFQNNLEIKLPDFNKFEIKTGLRLKGQKRTPFWGQVENKFYTINGLYKNGWTFSFLAAKEMVSDGV